MGLVRIKLLGRSFRSNAGDSLPGARPASSTTRRPCSGGQAGIICRTMYSSDCNVTKGGYWSGAGLGEALSLGLAGEGHKNLLTKARALVSWGYIASHANLQFLPFLPAHSFRHP